MVGFNYDVKDYYIKGFGAIQNFSNLTTDCIIHDGTKNMYDGN